MFLLLDFCFLNQLISWSSVATRPFEASSYGIVAPSLHKYNNFEWEKVTSDKEKTLPLQPNSFINEQMSLTTLLHEQRKRNL